MILFTIDRVLVINNFCCLVIIIVLSSSHNINIVHQPSRVALLYSIDCLWNNKYIFGSFLISSSFGSQLSQERE